MKLQIDSKKQKKIVGSPAARKNTKAAERLTDRKRFREEEVSDIFNIFRKGHLVFRIFPFQPFLLRRSIPLPPPHWLITFNFVCINFLFFKLILKSSSLTLRLNASCQYKNLITRLIRIIIIGLHGLLYFWSYSYLKIMISSGSRFLHSSPPYKEKLFFFFVKNKYPIKSETKKKWERKERRMETKWGGGNKKKRRENFCSEGRNLKIKNLFSWWNPLSENKNGAKMWLADEKKLLLLGCQR